MVSELELMVEPENQVQSQKEIDLTKVFSYFKNRLLLVKKLRTCPKKMMFYVEDYFREVFLQKKTCELLEVFFLQILFLVDNSQLAKCEILRSWS
jgi:hypothetical protein